MVPQIYIACDGDWDEPEVQISGSIEALVDFAKLLNKVETDLSCDLLTCDIEYYPANIKQLIVEYSDSGNDRLTILVDKERFKILGEKVALNKLSRSLTNFFNEEASIGDHFQLDYYEGNEVLNATRCHLIFICDR